MEEIERSSAVDTQQSLAGKILERGIKRSCFRVTGRGRGRVRVRARGRGRTTF